MYAIDLMPLFISLFFLAVVVLWLAIQNYKNVTITAVIIPLTLLATVISYMTVDRILGYPNQSRYGRRLFISFSYRIT